MTHSIDAALRPAAPPSATARGLFGTSAAPDAETRAREVLAGLGMSADEWSRRFGSGGAARSGA